MDVNAEVAVSNETLRSCPFCGGDASFEHVHAKATDGMRWSVGCNDEDCHGYMSFLTHERKTDAAKAWNKRADYRKPCPHHPTWCAVSRPHSEDHCVGTGNA